MKVYANRLPVILAFTFTILTAVIGYAGGVDNTEIYLRCVVSLAVFYMIGLFLKYNLSLAVSLSEKHRREEKINAAKEKARKKEENKGVSSRIDYVVGDNEEEFSPLTASRVIRREMNE